ncbi:putative Trehalose monomycolate exporter MmpL3 [Blattamonas nauphoetae]|uniref:Trehalose monomycolate exporter MmpL3 n=1 Tax=Blattamonas nauphoetae TaxID=2049346 RepID=A0ABQ9YHZ7_9EUKA|nr:putative Trehalose monomycolate exporter MmpL3 [Blattamonas nauphoetae]
MSETSLSLLAAKGAQSYEARQIQTHWFPNRTADQTAFCFVHNLEFKEVTEIPCLPKFQQTFRDDLLELEKSSGRKMFRSDMIGYFLTENQYIRSPIVSNNKNGTVMMIQLHETGRKLQSDFNLVSTMVDKSMNKACTKTEQKQFIYGMMGINQFLLETRDNIMDDLAVMDTICIPLAIVVLIIMLRSIRLVLITIFATATSILTSFLVMFPIAKYLLEIPTFAPSLMMSICLALSVDYSLFLLSRFREEILKGRSVYRSVHQMLKFGGRIIALSGIILTIAFLSNLFLRNNLLFGIGTTAAVATFINLTVNFLLIPSLILAFPSFFSDFGYLGIGTCLSKVSCCRNSCWGKLGIHEMRMQTEEGILQEYEREVSEKKQKRKKELEQNRARGIVDNNGVDIEDDLFRSIPIPTEMDEPTETTLLRHHQQTLKASDEEEGEKAGDAKEERSALIARILLHNQNKSRWFRLARWTAQPLHAVIIVILLLLVTVPFALEYTMHMRQSLDNTQILAQGSKSLKVYQTLKKDFPPGLTQPMQMLFDASECGGVFNEAFMDYARDMLTAMCKMFPTIFSKEGMVSVLFTKDMDLTFDLIQAAYNDECREDADLQEMCDGVMYLFNLSMSPVNHNASMLVSIGTILDPMSEALYDSMPDIYNWTATYLKDHPKPKMGTNVQRERRPLLETMTREEIVRMKNSVAQTVEMAQALPPRALPSPSSNTHHTPTKPSPASFVSPDKMVVGYDGNTNQMIDSVRQIYKVLPPAMAISLSVVFVVVGIIFKSIVVPIRTVFTLATTLFIVYGFLTLTFQNQFLSPLISFLKDVDSLYFFIPVFGYSLVIGLALDYDIFLFYRIAEYRDKGYKTHSAVVKATAHSGAIITAAGIVMAIAFFGLIMSKMVVLVEMGVLLVTTVLLDTFVVRLFLVPALCSLFGEGNWFPGCWLHAKVTKTENDMSDLAVNPEETKEEEEWLDWMKVKKTSRLRKTAEKHIVGENIPRSSSKYSIQANDEQR